MFFLGLLEADGFYQILYPFSQKRADGRAGSSQDVQPEIGILLWTGGMYDVSSNILLHCASMVSTPCSTYI